MPLIHLSLSFSSGPGWPRWGRAEYCWSKMPTTCPEVVTAKAVCKCTPRASPAGVNRAQFRDGVQAGEVQCGGVLDDEEGILVEALLGGRGGDAEMQRLGGHAVIGIEAIGGRGLAGIAGRLGDRGGGTFEGIVSTRIAVSRLSRRSSGRSATAAT